MGLGNNYGGRINSKNMDPILSKVYNQEMSSSAPIKLAAVIVETRPISTIVDVINEHFKFLPVNTDLYWYSSPSNCVNELFPYLKLNGGSGTLFKDVQVFRESDYNTLLTWDQFWKAYLDYDRVLIFQHDSVILRQGIEEFYPYQYVGSPWKFQEHGGNGGISLRDPKAMMEICQEFKWDRSYGNEDVFFSNVMHAHPDKWKLAPRDVCMKFGCEVIETYGTFAAHAIDKYHSPEVCERIKNQYKKQEA